MSCICGKGMAKMNKNPYSISTLNKELSVCNVCENSILAGIDFFHCPQGTKTTRYYIYYINNK